jgi:chromosome segregation ATPase
MSDPVLMDKADLAKTAKELDQAAENQAKMAREIKVLNTSLAQALDAANRAKVEIGQLRKALPSDKVQIELKGLRASMGEAHKRINVLEKELVAAKAETEVRRKETGKVMSRFEGVQSTFDTMQVGRDKACADRDQALANVQKGAEAYHKLNTEFEAFKKAAAEAKQPQKPAKAPEPAKA